MRVLSILVLFTLALFASVGEIAAVSGSVSVIRDQAQLAAQNGFKLEQKDEIKSGEDGKAQVLFSDGTVITIGKNSNLKVEEFVFDGGSKESKAKFGMGNGVFKAITGQIGKINPDNMKLQTKTATIGIRGTQILALLDDAQEKIACTEGGIYVDVRGYIVDVPAGQMTTILAGALPSAPTEIKPEDMQQFRGGLGIGKELAAKIGSVKIDKNMNADSAQLKEIFDDISKIKEDDTRTAALDLLEDILINQVEALYEAGSYKVAAPKSSMVAYTKNDGYKPLGWGYYTQKEVISQGSAYLVDGISYGSYTDAIKAAIIKEAWREQSSNYTPASIVAAAMGGDKVSEVAPNSWDGTAQSRIIAQYSGKILGFEKYTKVIGDQDVATAPQINTPFEQNSNNKVNIVIDFGNRVVYGNIGFDKKLSDGSLKSFDIGFVDGGKIALAPTSLFMTNYFSKNGNEEYLEAETYQGRFFGSDYNQLSFYTHLFYGNECGSDCIEAYSVDGAVIASKDDAKTVTLTKHQAGKDDYFSWGYWASDSFDKAASADIKKANVSGGYIKPNDSVTETPLSKMDELKLSNIKASYTADIIGTVHSHGTNTPTELIQKGSALFNFDFGKGSMSGEMGIESQSTFWHLQLQKGTIDGNKFEITNVANFADATQKVQKAEVEGSFFGKNGELIGGGFNLVSTDNKVAIGAFHGERR